MTNSVLKDREGNTIEKGMVVALAVTLNQRLHYNNFTTRIVKEKDGELILDGAGSWSWVKDHEPREMQILHPEVNMMKMDTDFWTEFRSDQSYSAKDVSSQDAHDFYHEVVGSLSRKTIDYLEISSAREAREILLNLLSLAGASDEVIKGKIDKERLKLAVMQERFAKFAQDISNIR